MGMLSVSDLKPGLKVANAVYTPLGGLLIQKGKVLLPRDLDVLQAFMVEQIEIEGSVRTSSPAQPIKETKPVIAPPEALRPTDSFQQEYDRMLSLLKSAYQSVIVSNVPVYDLRIQLERLLSMQKSYNIMTFSPKNTNEYDYMFHNGILSALTSYNLAQWYGMPQKDWVQVALAGLLHDIGNAKVDPKILYSPDQLSADETEDVRLHTTYGYHMLRNVMALNEGVRLTALQHHEKVDGSGYPLHLVGDKIHIYAKIVAVADIFHAMTLKSRYRKAMSPYLVLEEINSEAFGKLDPVIVQTFINKVTQLHNGIKVRLNTDEVGEIIFTDRNYPTRPMVNVNGKIINLAQNRQFNIEEILN